MCYYNVIQKEQLLLRQDDGDTEDAAEMTPKPRPANVVATSCDLLALLSLGLMYVKQFTSFCRALKRCAQKKIGSMFLPRGVITVICVKRARTSTICDTFPCTLLEPLSNNNTRKITSRDIYRVGQKMSCCTVIDISKATQ